MTDGPTGDCAEHRELLQSQEAISRRRLLQVLGGAGAAVAAWSLLPGKWTRPVVEASILPQTAQTSPTRVTLRITSLSARGVFGEGATTPSSPPYLGSFNYSDDLGQVDDSATLAAEIVPCGRTLFNQSLADLERSVFDLVRSGTASSGTISFRFKADPRCANPATANLCITLGVTGRSASACTTLMIPK
jgi:hypothetical protein